MVTETSLGWMARLVCDINFLHPVIRCSSCPRLAAMSDFAKKQDEWYATWPQGDDRAFIM